MFRSEVTSVLKNPLRGGKIEKIVSEIKSPFEKKKNSVFLRKSVLRNYIIISLHRVAYAFR